jgi:pimeloyl-ACP methyl ester carboxylesterase
MTPSEFPVFGQQVSFDCSLFEPDSQHDYYGSQRPALVFVHGFMSSKVYFSGLIYELTRRGFVCLAITANGHAASGGAFTPTWQNVTLSAVKYLRDSSTLLRIDQNRIGLVGHSMGAFSVTVASLLDQELGNFWLNATVAIGGPFLNITRGFGTGFAYFLNNTMVYPNVWYDPGEAMQDAIIEGRTNDIRPTNYMNIIGSKDEAFSVNSAYELIYGMSTPTFWADRGVPNQSQVITEKTYGAFDNGTARRLVVIPGVDHLLEGQDQVTFIEIINWFETSMKLNYPTAFDPSTMTEDYRLLGLAMTGIGGVILILPLVAYLGDWLKSPLVLPRNAMRLEKNTKRKMFLIYGIVFVGLSFLVTPIISGLNLNTLIPTDFLGSNLISLPLLILGLLMIPAIIILIWYEKRTYKLELSDFGLTKQVTPYLKAALYGFLLFFIFYIIQNLAASGVIHNLFIWRFAGFLELFLYLFIGMLVFELFFRGLIQNKLYTPADNTGLIPTRWMEILKAALLTGFIEGLAMGIIVTMMLATGGFNVFATGMAGMIPSDMGISFGTLPPMFLMLPPMFILLEIALAFIKAGLYREINRNIMASSIFMALMLAWLLSVILPAIDPHAARFVFMT